MEIVKYICEFFFTDFWHWSGLLIFLVVIFGSTYIKATEINNYKNK